MDWRLFGYDYPETRADSDVSAGTTIAELYSGSVRGRMTNGQLAGMIHLAISADEAEYTDWVINTSAAPLDLPPTFVVQFSLVGDFSSDASTDLGIWSVMLPAGHHQAKRLVGRVELLSKRATVDEMTLHGTVSLTSSLLDQIETGNLQSLDEKDVVPFLKDRLSWKIYGVSRCPGWNVVAKLFTKLEQGDGTQLPDLSLNSIRIIIASETARIPSDPKAPIAYSNMTVAHSEVTAGKMGGAD